MITLYPAKILNKKLERVEVIDEKIKDLTEQMIAQMHQMRGVGIAANQIGVDLQVAILCEGAKKGNEIIIINPEIIETEGWQNSVEGCLSFPGVAATIRRHKKVTFKYQDLEGEWHEMTTEGQLANIVQHEIHHLRGTHIAHCMNPMDKVLNKQTLKFLKESSKWETEFGQQP